MSAEILRYLSAFQLLTRTAAIATLPLLALISNPFLWSLLYQPSNVREQIDTGDTYYQIRWPTYNIFLFKAK